MRNFKIITFVTLFFLISCNSNDEQVESSYFDKNVKSKVDSFVEDSVDNFSEQLEADGGFFMWKNYKDYLGLGDRGFKERIHDSWNKAYDNETLELYINTELAKKHGASNLKIEKSLSEIDNYYYVLLFPFLTIAIEELIIWIVLFLIIEFIIIPYVAKRTLRKEHKTNNFWSNLAFSIISNGERQNRINARVEKVRKVFNTILFISLSIFTLFYYDFNGSLNKTLKTNIKKDILENINIKINDLSN
jgi:hypothetical protein